MVRVMNFIEPRGGYISVCSPREVSPDDRRLRTNREIIVDVISWLNEAPIAFKSSTASCDHLRFSYHVGSKIRIRLRTYEEDECVH
jgi:hypothetical protein